MLARHGIRPRRSLGQHFLVDPNIVSKIVDAAGIEPGMKVVEVGAGTGALTTALAETGATVLAFETDRSLEPLLSEVLAGVRGVEVRWVDVTQVDLVEELRDGGWRMVSNLPYGVAAPLVADVLRRVPQVDELVVMVQKEVADRLCASPGDPAYGLPSLVVGLHGEARILFRVPPTVFYPPPNVESAVVRITRRAPPPRAEEALRLAGRAFGGRRKMLRRSLGLPEEVFARAGVDPTARPETLEVGDWLRLVEVAGA
jgi:16S rRNA (adenine1518-N6/adenine1519-N6)-dimethyltransferase